MTTYADDEPFHNCELGPEAILRIQRFEDIPFTSEGTTERVDQVYEKPLETDGDDGSQTSLAANKH